METIPHKPGGTSGPFCSLCRPSLALTAPCRHRANLHQGCRSGADSLCDSAHPILPSSPSFSPRASTSDTSPPSNFSTSNSPSHVDPPYNLYPKQRPKPRYAPPHPASPSRTSTVTNIFSTKWRTQPLHSSPRPCQTTVRRVRASRNPITNRYLCSSTKRGSRTWYELWGLLRADGADLRRAAQDYRDAFYPQGFEFDIPAPQQQQQPQQGQQRQGQLQGQLPTPGSQTRSLSPNIPSPGEAGRDKRGSSEEKELTPGQRVRVLSPLVESPSLTSLTAPKRTKSRSPARIPRAQRATC